MRNPDLSTAVVHHLLQPFGRVVSSERVAIGIALADTMPTAKGQMICRVNGGPGFVSRKEWDYRLQSGDIVEWFEHPLGGEDSAGPLQLVLAFAIFIVTENPYPLILALAGQAINALTAPSRRNEEQLQQSPTYATGLSGNQARLYQVVPKICGRHQTFPPYACQPYNEFADDGEQYLYVVLALGIGNHEIERTLIDDTDINHFSDVLECTYLPPGTPPSVVNPNVINSPEVANQDMLTGEFIGGFASCGPRVLATDIGIDVVAPFGLGSQDNSGNLEPLEVRWRVEIAELNEFGTRISPWSVLANEARTAASREPQRWSVKYSLPTPIRAEIRIVRTDVKSANARVLNNLVWSGMRAYADTDTQLNPEVAHFEVIMRSSKQLSGVSQNRISVIANAMVRELQEDGFGPEIASRNPADWLADLWTSQTWGLGLDESQVDLATLFQLRQVWESRQDRFDYVFDTSVDADAAAQIIAGSGRATAFRRNGVYTLVRDQEVTLPRTAFTTRNTVPGSMLISEELPREDMPDGVIVEYFDNRAWNFGQPLECPCPGVVTMQRPVRIRKAGITGRTHALREGLYEAAKIAYRRQTVGCTTEMQGMLPAFGSATRWQTEVMRWQSGDVVEWDADTLVARLTEPPRWDLGPLHIIFTADDGSPTDPIAVTPGDLTTEAVLAAAPPFNPVTEDGTRDRTQYLIGRLEDDEMIVKVSSIADGGVEGGAQLYKITGFVDDERVHQADEAYLPGPGEIQDPIDTTEGEEGGGTTPVVNFSFGGSSNDVPFIASWSLLNDGRNYDNIGGAATPLEWLFVNPVGTDVTSQFEVRFTHTGGDLAALDTGASAPLDTWLNLGTTRTLQTVPGLACALEFTVQIRDIATSTVQDSGNVLLLVISPIGGG